MKKILFVAWVNFDRRSDLLAQHLQAGVRFVQVGKRGSILHAPARYLKQSVMTWQILRKERPDIVITQTPPIFAALLLYIFCITHKTQFAIDAHSSTFIDSIWAKLWRLHRFLSKRAVITIVPNKDLELIVEKWGARTTRLGFTPGDYTIHEDYKLDKDHFNIAMVCSFDDDEPIKEVFEAAQRVPDVTFYITGNVKRLAPKLVTQKPENCIFTGYLPEAQYVGLLRGVDAVMDLTLHEHTLLMGAYEAVSLGKPLITSNSHTLCEYFPIGTVHVANTPEGICDGIRRAQLELDPLKQDIIILKEQLQHEWDEKFGELRQILLAD